MKKPKEGQQKGGPIAHHLKKPGRSTAQRHWRAISKLPMGVVKAQAGPLDPQTSLVRTMRIEWEVESLGHERVGEQELEGV